MKRALPLSNVFETMEIRECEHSMRQKYTKINFRPTYKIKDNEHGLVLLWQRKQSQNLYDHILCREKGRVIAFIFVLFSMNVHYIESD